VESQGPEPRLRPRAKHALTNTAVIARVMSGTGGDVRSQFDAVQAVMTGAHAVQVVSAILQAGGPP
jgi:dihydroorotate dehydrogenase